MKHFLKAFRILTQVIKNAENEEYEDKEALKDDLFFAFGVIKQNFPEFPFFLGPEDKSAIMREVIDKNQMEYANDWMDMEPELKYKNEWSQKEAIEAFEEYLIQQSSSEAARQLAEVLKPSVAQDYRKALRKNTKRDDILNLYDRLKHEQSKETIFLSGAREEDKES